MTIEHLTITDESAMRAAIAAGELGTHAVRPNPRVGCVLVKDCEIIGQGFHARAGGPHAEAVALAQAGQNARGSTAFVTLEPCNHFGRTPPCARALIDAGIERVVIGALDPNALAHGGADALRDSQASRCTLAFAQRNAVIWPRRFSSRSRRTGPLCN